MTAAAASDGENSKVKMFDHRRQLSSTAARQQSQTPDNSGRRFANIFKLAPPTLSGSTFNEVQGRSGTGTDPYLRLGYRARVWSCVSLLLLRLPTSIAGTRRDLVVPAAGTHTFPIDIHLFLFWPGRPEKRRSPLNRRLSLFILRREMERMNY